jgi:hypothetical protein
VNAQFGPKAATGNLKTGLRAFPQGYQNLMKTAQNTITLADDKRN